MNMKSNAVLVDDPLEEYEWDPSESTVTAWSAANTRLTKGRRAYGRRGSKKTTYGSKQTNKKRAIEQEWLGSAEAEESNGSLFEPSDSISSFERKSTSSSMSSFDPSSSRSDSARGLAIPRPNSGLGRHKRSKSITNLKDSSGLPSLRRSLSVSAAGSARATSTSSTSTIEDWNLDRNENTNPNLVIEEGFPLLSPHPEAKHPAIGEALPLSIELSTSSNRDRKLRRRRGRTSSSPSFSSPGTDKSFSNLAKSAELAVAWIKPPNLSPSGQRNTIGLDMRTFREARDLSPAESSLNSSGRKRGVCGSPTEEREALSSGGFSFSQTSTTSSFRSKSRSRIFSIESLQEPPTPKMPTEDRREHDGDDSDSQESDKESAPDGTASDASASDDSVDFGLDEDICPPKGLRRASSSDFQEAVFGRKPRKSLSADDVFDTMSSYEDLKFLIKALRKEKMGNSLASFGVTKTWTVAPSAAWPSTRRAAFLQWTTNTLGFSLRPAGGSVAFLQIASSKGAASLELLEKALTAHKMESNDRRGGIPSVVTTKAVRPDLLAASHGDAPSLPLMSVGLPKPKRTTSVSRGARPSGDGALEADLLRQVESLAITNAQPMDESATVEASASDPPLIRIVTLNPSEDHVSPRLSTLVCEASPHRLSHERPRLSGEHHVGAQDLMLHLHGHSPRASIGRPPRLSSASGRPSGIVARHAASPSPYGPPPSTVSRGGQKNQFSFDGMETPLVKRSWGGPLPPGARDWGASERCPEDIIRQLHGRLELAYKASEFQDGLPFGRLSEEDGNGSCLLPPTFASTAISSSDLGFDLEVDTKMRETSNVDEMEEEELDEEEDDFDVDENVGLPGPRRSSVGASEFAGLHLYEETDEVQDKMKRRRMLSFAKHRRVSLCATALPSVRPMPASRKSLFARPSLSTMLSSRESLMRFEPSELPMVTSEESEADFEDASSPIAALQNPTVLSAIFSYLRESDLLCSASVVCSSWADIATEAHATLMLVSVGCPTSMVNPTTRQESGYDSDEDSSNGEEVVAHSVALSMERPWKYIVSQFPWACFLSEGAFKRVYKVWNSATQSSEAVSVMDVDLIESTGNKTVVGAELAVSVMLSSLVRRNVCPNFVITRGVFTCPYEPPAAVWGASESRKPKGGTYRGQPLGRKPREPSAKNRGKYQYIRMELCSEGDVEEYLKRQPDEVLAPEESRCMLFQIAFALHAAADRFSMKHYDVKLLNVFLQDAKEATRESSQSGPTVLRYGLGSHVFALRMPEERSVVAKLADYGTANVQAESNGQPVTIAQFTTPENTPPEFLLLGDASVQGHGHDSFGLGLCMLHLFTGHAPYEEILDKVKCPPAFKKKLCKIWQSENSSGYDVVRSVILADVYHDDEGNVEGEPDEVLYDTLYRYLVLFGVPDEKYKINEHGRVWRAIISTLQGETGTRRKAYGRSGKAGRVQGPDSAQFAADRKKYSLSHGNNKFISRARRQLEGIEGGMQLLLSLVNFDPDKRASALDVLNSTMMLPLREEPDVLCDPSEVQMSFMAYATR